MSIKSIKFAIRVYWHELFGDTTTKGILMAIGVVIGFPVAAFVIIKLFGSPWDYIFYGISLVMIVLGLRGEIKARQ